MPPLETQTISPLGSFLIGGYLIAVLGALVGGVVAIAVKVVLVAGVAGVVIVVCIAALLPISYVANRHRLARLHAAREGETMATFVFALDWRRLDPWVVRATWDCLQAYVPFDGRTYPFHADDRLEAFGIDGEELDYIGRDIAHRAGRSLATTEDNPWYGRVDTVADLVHFIDAQPRRATA